MANAFIDKLLREHGEMKSILALIREQLQTIEQGGIPNMTLFGYALYYMRKFPSALHHPKEDLLFERLQKRAPWLTVGLDWLREQHRVIYELENWLAEVAAQVPKRGAAVYPRITEFGRRYLMVQREHSDMEEQEIFPMAKRFLKQEDWDFLDGPSWEATGPSFGTRQPQRFHMLFDYIIWQARAETRSDPGLVEMAVKGMAAPSGAAAPGRPARAGCLISLMS